MKHRINWLWLVAALFSGVATFCWLMAAITGDQPLYVIPAFLMAIITGVDLGMFAVSVMKYQADR